MRSERITAATVFAFAFFKFSVIGFFLLPPWSVNDEPGHYSYVMEFARGNFHPVHGVTKLDPEAESSQQGEVNGRPNYILSHPPLYYLALSPFGFVVDKFTDDPTVILRFLRVVNAAIGAIGVLFIMLAAVRLRLSTPAVWFATIITLSNPNFAILSGGVTNDIGVFALASMGGYFLIAYLQDHRLRYEALCLVAFMASALCKSTGLPLFVGMVGYFGIVRILERRISLKWLGALCILLVPLFLWHLSSYLNYGSWVRLGSLRSARVLSPDDFTFWDFIRKSPVVDKFISSYLGHVWIRRSALDLILIRLSDGVILQSYIVFLGFLICTAAFLVGIGERFSGASKVYRLISFGISAVLGLSAAYLVARRSFAAPLVTGGLTFLGVYSLLNLKVIFCSPLVPVRFTLLTFGAFFFMVLVALYSIYEVQLIYGSARATHGRYFYALAPLFLVGITYVLDNAIFRRFAFPVLVAVSIAFESFYWNGYVFPTHSVFKVFLG